MKIQRVIPAVVLAAFTTSVGVSVTSGTVRSAYAQPSTTDSASEHFVRGVAFYKDSDFTAALVEFKRAYEIDPNYPVLYNIGQTSRELRDYAGALTAFEKYLTEGTKSPDQGHLGSHKDKVESYISELKPKIGEVTVVVNVDGAELSVDDVSVGVTPITKPINMNAGRRKLSVTKSGYTLVQKFVDIAGTDQKTVNLELVALGTPDGNHGKDDGTPPPKKGLSPAPFVLLGITGAAGIATIVLGVRALGTHGDLQDALGKFPGNPSDIESKRTTAKNFAIAADVMGGLTIAGAATTVILFVATAPSSDAKPKPAAATVSATIGPSSLGLVGTF